MYVANISHELYPLKIPLFNVERTRCTSFLSPFNVPVCLSHAFNEKNRSFSILCSRYSCPVVGTTSQCPSLTVQYITSPLIRTFLRLD